MLKVACRAGPPSSEALAIDEELADEVALAADGGLGVGAMAAMGVVKVPAAGAPSEPPHPVTAIQALAATSL